MASIDWKIFEENSSSRDALVDFATGHISLANLKRQCWMQEAKKETDRMKRIGVKRARTLARRWCTRSGYDWKEECQK